MITLSILIPSIYSRGPFLYEMLTALDAQLTDPARESQVEILTLEDDGESSIGEKRNELLSAARGEYVAFVDDDDELAPDYVSRILAAAQSEPDVITFDMERYRDGKLYAYQTMRLANGYEIDESDPNLLQYRYPPTHLCPIKRELAQQIWFNWANKGEDRAWQDEVKPLLKTEEHIDAVLYKYLYRTDRAGEMTNEVRNNMDTELEREIDAEFWHMLAFLR